MPNYYERESVASKKNTWPKNAEKTSPTTILSRFENSNESINLWQKLDGIPAVLWVEALRGLLDEGCGIIFSLPRTKDSMSVTILDGTERKRLYLSEQSGTILFLMKAIGNKRLTELAAEDDYISALVRDAADDFAQSIQYPS